MIWSNAPCYEANKAERQGLEEAPGILERPEVASLKNLNGQREPAAEWLGRGEHHTGVKASAKIQGWLKLV